MKILQIFGAVVAVHVLAFIFIFASPGCSSTPRNIPTPDATVPVSDGMSPAPASTSVGYTPAPVDLGAAPVTTQQGRTEPTRPGSPNAAALAPAKPAVEDVAPVGTYTVSRGDSLWSIAKKHRLTVNELAKANGLPTGATLQPGKKLMIPGKPGVAPKDLAAPAPKPVEAKPAVRSADAVEHVIQSGESLGTIARKFQVSVGELAAANNITDPAKIRAGQRLVIPGYKAVGNKTPAPKPAPTQATPAPASSTPTPAAEPVVTPAAPHFEIAAPPPGQDLDAGLPSTATEVPTIKVEEAPATPPKG